ncbi:MAG: flippase, partial [Alphaproteobacteria bacterium]
LVAVPILLHGLGTDRFGLFTLAVIVIGYVSLFDLGLGQALTKLVADRLGDVESRKEIPALIWTTLVVMFGVGMILSALLALSAPGIVGGGTLKIPPGLAAEVRTSLFILAATLPVVICSAGLRGVLESYQRFDLGCIVRIASGSATYLAPLAALALSADLPKAVAAVAIGRVLAALINLWFIARIVPELAHDVRFDRKLVKPLAQFGGWVTVTSVIYPLLMYLDRFLVGGLVSTAAIAYYGTPYDIVTRLWFVPWALTGVLFPAFATMTKSAPGRTQALFLNAVKYVFLAMFPAALLLIAFAHEGLQLWLGADFAGHSAPVVRWLAVGVFLNSFAQIAGVLVTGSGRADISAKLGLIQVPLYVALVWWLTKTAGVEGTAVAWTTRAAVSSAVLILIAARMANIRGRLLVLIGAAIGCALVGFAVAAAPFALAVKVVGCVAALVVFAVAAWAYALTANERTMIFASFGRK